MLMMLFYMRYCLRRRNSICFFILFLCCFYLINKLFIHTAGEKYIQFFILSYTFLYLLNFIPWGFIIFKSIRSKRSKHFLIFQLNFSWFTKYLIFKDIIFVKILLSCIFHEILSLCRSCYCLFTIVIYDNFLIKINETWVNHQINWFVLLWLNFKFISIFSNTY